MSKELKWALNYLKAVNLASHHKRHKIRIKNFHRWLKLSELAIKKWGYIPIPPEWSNNEQKTNN